MDPSDIDALIDDRPEDGVFRVHADALRSPDVFALELEHIFEGSWSFVGLEAQIPAAYDFFTTRLGRQSVLVARDAAGRVGGFINSCRHRGSLVCHWGAGNAKHHVCPYHGWAYDSAGRNVAIPAEAQGAYTAAFARENHDLRPVARFGSYRGFLFASLNPEVPPLEQYLGDARLFIDLVADQGEDGIELVPGTVTYTYSGNWKMQIENSADAYHFVPTHRSYIELLGRRNAVPDGRVSVLQKSLDPSVAHGTFCLPHGHNVLWSDNQAKEARPLYQSLDSLRRRVGAVRARWMFYTRNVLYFPNMQLLENASLQIRVNRPLAADRTEITTYCIAPKGESPAARTQRIRQYEEFFNPSGLATPDDTTIFEDCQAGQQSRWVDWHQGYMRGLAAVRPGADDAARELGIAPVSAVASRTPLSDETIFHGPWREWRRLLRRGVARANGSNA